MAMIDFSITRDAKWIAQREEVWKSLEEDFKEGLRKKELADLKEYFFTGIVPNGRKYPDLALFNWFPIQTAEGWDYVFQQLVQKPQSFEKIFYFSFSELEHRAFNEKQELDLWDYFAGDSFSPVVASRVPVGPQKQFVQFDIDPDTLSSKIGGAIILWLQGGYGGNPKWIRRINYYLEFAESLDDSHFVLDSDGDPKTLAGRILRRLMIGALKPDEFLQRDNKNNDARIQFLSMFKNRIDEMELAPLKRKTWEEVKLKYGA